MLFEDSEITDSVDNDWGGFWTELKIDIFIKYLKAYLDIMNKYKFELTYFDGFAGSGTIESRRNHDTALEGIGMRVLGMEHQRKFDIYYLVDLNLEKIKALKEKAISKFPLLFQGKNNIHLVAADCNDKLKSLAYYISCNRNKRRALAIVDPFGMQVDWSSIAACKGLGIDMWILVPTGLGLNRLMKNDGNINDSWKQKLSNFLGMSEEEIMKFFYKETRTQTLFGEEVKITKEEQAAQKAAKLYVERLRTIWEFVAEPLVMKNKVNSIMYHFIFATNNKAGLRIANDIMKKLQ